MEGSGGGGGGGVSSVVKLKNVSAAAHLSESSRRIGVAGLTTPLSARIESVVKFAGPRRFPDSSMKNHLKSSFVTSSTVPTCGNLQ